MPRPEDVIFYDCKNGKHAFEARYDTKPTPGITLAGELGPASLASLETKTYVRDICVLCGKTIERDGTND